MYRISVANTISQEVTDESEQVTAKRPEDAISIFGIALQDFHFEAVYDSLSIGYPTTTTCRRLNTIRSGQEKLRDSVPPWFYTHTHFLHSEESDFDILDIRLAT